MFTHFSRMRQSSSKLTLRHQVQSFNRSRHRFVCSADLYKQVCSNAYLTLHPADGSQARYAELQTQGRGNKHDPIDQCSSSQIVLYYLSLSLQVKVAGGSILVRPLTQAWVDECGALLTGAFADAMGYVPMYRSVTLAGGSCVSMVVSLTLCLADSSLSDSSSA